MRGVGGDDIGLTLDHEDAHASPIATESGPG